MRFYTPVACLLLLAAGGCAFTTELARQSVAPEQVARLFIQHVQAGEIEAAMKYVLPSQRAEARNEIERELRQELTGLPERFVIWTQIRTEDTWGYAIIPGWNACYIRQNAPWTRLGTLKLHMRKVPGRWWIGQ